MKKDIYYCMVLSEEQLDFLAGSKYGIDRMKVLRHLIDTVAVKETEYKKKGFAVTLHVGQAALSEVDLANRLGYDKKTVSRLLDRMSALGIVTSEQTNRTSIHTVHCVSAWYADNQKILNPYYVSMKERYESHAENGNADSNGDGIVTESPNLVIEKPDTTVKANFHSSSECAEVSNTPVPATSLENESDTTPHAGKQPVLSSLSSEVATESGSDDSLSTDAEQGQFDNPTAEKVQPRQL